MIWAGANVWDQLDGPPLLEVLALQVFLATVRARVP
jgi:hypothetical protein